MKMKASETLIRAKAVIKDPKNWTQGTFARNSLGEAAGAISSSAVCFCSLGALKRIEWSSSFHLQLRLNEAACGSIVDYNDTHTHEQVMEVWDKAIAKAIADESNKLV